MLIQLAEMGVILSVSRQMKPTKARVNTCLGVSKDFSPADTFSELLVLKMLVLMAQETSEAPPVARSSEPVSRRAPQSADMKYR
ncbi:MAG: hypothetical protein ACLU38_09425 [Dysosmobacter sp.]